MPLAFPVTNGMDPKEKELLERTFDYARENNRILKSIRSAARRSAFLKAIYWLIIVVVAIWLYYYLEPYLKSLMPVFKNLGGSGDLSELLKSGKLPN